MRVPIISSRAALAGARGRFNKQAGRLVVVVARVRRDDSDV